jgi:hypothetical protein
MEECREFGWNESECCISGMAVTIGNNNHDASTLSLFTESGQKNIPMVA